MLGGNKMRKLAYILILIASILIISGIVLELIKHDCSNKNIKEYFESDICRNVGNN